MLLAHKIALDPTFEQRIYFARAAGVARFAYNWALAEWRRQYEAGEKPSASKIKASWNKVRREQFLWSCDVTKCASGQAILNLGAAFSNFFRDLKKPKGQRRFRYPTFKRKGVHDSFALWNDQFAVDGARIRMPHLGWVRMLEPLRLSGKIMGAVVSRTADRWFVAVQVDVADNAVPHAAAGSVVGVDVGIATLATLSQPLPDGRATIPNPRARHRLLGKIKRLSRRISRQEEMRKRRAAKTSRRQQKRRMQLSRLHARTANIRRDACHKATAAITDAFETVVLEDLNVSGMSKNHALAGAVLDCGFHEFRRQCEYKARMKGGRVVIAHRFFPSSKTCSDCGHVVAQLPLSVREWTCPDCGSVHDRDRNAAINLELVGRASAEPLALPATHGDIAALAASQEAAKLRWSNRELDPCAHARTN